MKKNLITVIILLFAISIGHAQHYEHFTSWNRIALQKKINEHWEIIGDVHWRRQSNFTSPSINPLALKLMEGVRITTTYRIKYLAFSFAPFFMHSSQLYSKNLDLTKPDRLEFRPTFFTEWTKTLSSKWSIRSRLGYEYRIFKRIDDVWGDEQARLRLRLQLRYAWDSQNTIIVSEEPLYNIPPNMPANSFNQNQLYFAYNHAFSPHFSTEIGYIWNHRQRASLIEFDEENVLQTHFIFRL
jgi:hypothetical protein